MSWEVVEEPYTPDAGAGHAPQRRFAAGLNAAAPWGGHAG